MGGFTVGIRLVQKLQTWSPTCSEVQSCPTLCDPVDCSMQASLSFTISLGLLKLMSIESMMPSNHLILGYPLLLSSVFPASGSFPMSRLFASGGQRIGSSASTSGLPLGPYPYSATSGRWSYLPEPQFSWLENGQQLDSSSQLVCLLPISSYQ